MESSTEAEENIKIKAYDIDPINPGYCLIIKNVNFGSKEDQTFGSIVDVFQRIFEQFRFKVLVEEDQTATKMKAAITKAVSEENMGNKSCFVLIILSNGKEDMVFGTDGKSLEHKTIVELMKNGCKALRHKPKICFIQTCNGEKESKKVKEPQIQSDGFEESKTLPLPPTSDILLSLAAQEDEISGGCYAQHFAAVLEQYAKTRDLETMLKLLEKKLRKDDIEYKSKNLSTCVKLIGWSRRFYFYPIQEIKRNKLTSNRTDARGGDCKT